MRRQTTTLILAAISVLLVSSTSHAAEQGNLLAEVAAETRLNTTFERIVTAINDKDADQALSMIDEALKVRPDDVALRNARAAALIQSERYEEATEVLRGLLTEDPNLFQADYNSAEILFLQGKHVEARDQFERLRTKYGDMPLLRFKILLCDAISGNNESAQTAARTFRFPTDAPAWYFAYAALAASAGNSAEARRLMDVATEIHGKDATSLFSESIETHMLKN